MSERRRTLRRDLHLPVVVKGHGRDGAWEERTTTSDICHGGVALSLARTVPMGQALHLSLPLPEMFRRYDAKAPMYRVYALVRYVDASGPPYRTGLMFVGRHPPRGYQDNPSGLFFLSGDPQPTGATDLLHPRYPLLLTVRLRRLEEAHEGPAEEVTITEDVSLDGARVRTTLPLVKGELVRLAEMDGPFCASAVVHHIGRGADKVTRLHLQFMNQEDAEAAVRDLLRRQGISIDE